MAKQFISEKWVKTRDAQKRSTWIVPVVNPQGTIKYLRVSPILNNSIISAEFDNPDDENMRCRSVQLKVGFSDAGWALYADLFVEDGLIAAWPHYQAWILRGPMVDGNGANTPWPAKYTPRGVTDRLQGIADHQALPDEVSIPELDDRTPAKPSRKQARNAGVELDM